MHELPGKKASGRLVDSCAKVADEVLDGRAALGCRLALLDEPHEGRADDDAVGSTRRVAGLFARVDPEADDDRDGPTRRAALRPGRPRPRPATASVPVTPVTET